MEESNRGRNAELEGFWWSTAGGRKGKKWSGWEWRDEEVGVAKWRSVTEESECLYGAQ